MKTCVVTIYNEKYKPIFEYIEPNLRSFCVNNNFSLEAYKIDEPYETLTFRKQGRIVQLIDSYDWVVWCDADIFIKKPTFDFRSLLGTYYSSFIVSKDNLGVCAGFFAVKNTEFGRKFINTWDFLHEFKSDVNIVFTSPENGNEGDQHTLRCLLRSFPVVRDNTDYFSENVISNPNSSEKDKTDSFAHHYFGRWLSVEDVLAGMKATVV